MPFGPLATGSVASGAPDDAQYVVMVANATLTQERILTQTANRITVTDGGAGAAVTLNTGAWVPLTNQANTFTTGVQQIETGAATNQALILKMTAGQTENVFEVQDSATAILTQMNATGWLGIGATAPLASPLHVEETVVASGAFSSSAPAVFRQTIDPAGDQTSGNNSVLQLASSIPNTVTNKTDNQYAAFCNVSNLSQGVVDISSGMLNQVYVNSTGTLDLGLGSVQSVWVAGGTVNTAVALRAQSLMQGGTVADFYGLEIVSLRIGGTITNRHGIHIGVFTGSATNDFAIYSAATQVSFLTGRLGIGDASPDAQLDVHCGSAGTRGTIIQGAAAQTASLLQLQDSTTGVVVDSGDGLAGSEFVFNQGGINIDFRVESATYDALLVDADNESIDIMHHASGKIGMYAVAPVVQAAHIADPAGGGVVDAEARTAIDAILVAIENIGITLAA